jgi:hypothetical protein
MFGEWPSMAGLYGLNSVMMCIGLILEGELLSPRCPSLSAPRNKHATGQVALGIPYCGGR